MKYEYHPQRRTEQERKELNEQILRLLQSGTCEQAGVTDEDIFNRYTGDGGLHGLQRSDYENYNAYSDFFTVKLSAKASVSANTQVIFIYFVSLCAAILCT